MSDRKKATAGPDEAELKYRTLFEQSPDGILIIDPSGKFLDFNSKAHLQLGYSREEFAQLRLSDIDPFETPEEIKKKIDDILSAGQAEHEVRHLTKQGEIRNVLVTTKTLVLSGKTVFHSIWRDITESKKAEEEVWLERERYRAIVDGQTEFINRYISGGFLTYVNGTLARYLDLPAEELIGKSFYPYVHEEDRERVIRTIETMGVENPFAVIENRVISPDGAVHWQQWTHRALFDSNGTIVEYQAMGRDITDRRRAEDALRRSEEFIRSVINSVDEGFLVVGPDYRIISANKAYCSTVSSEAEQIVGRHCFEVSHHSSRPCHEEGEECAVKRAFETGETHTAMHKHSDSRGNMLYVETKGFPLKDASGRVTSVIETIRNITEHHLLMEEQLKNQKLEAIGLLAGGLAHDFNNLLQGVFGYISMAKLATDPGEKAFGLLEQSEQGLQMAVSLTNQLLTFSKGGQPVKRKISLQPVLESCARFALSGSRTHCRLEIEKDLWSVEADEGQIAQVIQNIIINADQAMPAGGLLTISGRNLDVASPGSRTLTPAGKWVEIAIRDTGIGIPEEHLSRIFDPYFSTKQKGSGLGLATSYSIVRSHGGQIEAASNLNKGSTFTIRLPALETAISAPRPKAGSVSGQKGRVLVMDDDEVVRDVVGRMLRAIGHTVDFAGDGEKAIEMYRQAKHAGLPFDVVILDATVRGGMGGEEAIKALLEINPGLVAVVSSGYSDEAITADYASYGFKAFLAKPYSVAELDNVLNSVMSW